MFWYIDRVGACRTVFGVVEKPNACEGMLNLRIFLLARGGDGVPSHPHRLLPLAPP